MGPILLAAVEGGRWKPGIGDPTVMGWVTVAAYFVTAARLLWCRLARALARRYATPALASIGFLADPRQPDGGAGDQ